MIELEKIYKKIFKKMKYNIGQELEIGGKIKVITDILPVLMGCEAIDYIYELDDDLEQRYNTKELKELL